MFSCLEGKWQNSFIFEKRKIILYFGPTYHIKSWYFSFNDPGSIKKFFSEIWFFLEPLLFGLSATLHCTSKWYTLLFVVLMLPNLCFVQFYEYRSQPSKPERRKKSHIPRRSSSPYQSRHRHTHPSTTEKIKLWGCAEKDYQCFGSGSRGLKKDQKC